MIIFKKTVLVIAVLFLAVFDSSYPKNYDLIGSLSGDLGKIVSYPVNLKAEDLLVIGPSVLITAVLLNNDIFVRNRFKEINSSTLDTLSSIDIMGDGLFNLALCGLMFDLGGKKERLVARQVIESFFETGIVTNVIKYASGRHRPSTGDSQYSFSGPAFSFDSFPSGHTATAFSTATVLADAYDCWYVAYPLAALVGAARIYKDVHWSSDVFIGALTGYLIGKMHKIDYDRGDEKADLKIDFEGGSTVVKMVYNF